MHLQHRGCPKNPTSLRSELITHHKFPNFFQQDPKKPPFNSRSQEIKGRRNKEQKYLNQKSRGTPYAPRGRMSHWGWCQNGVFQDKLWSFLASELKAHSKLLHSSACSLSNALKTVLLFISSKFPIYDFTHRMNGVAFRDMEGREKNMKITTTTLKAFGRRNLSVERCEDTDYSNPEVTVKQFKPETNKPTIKSLIHSWPKRERMH